MYLKKYVYLWKIFILKKNDLRRHLKVIVKWLNVLVIYSKPLLFSYNTSNNNNNKINKIYNRDQQYPGLSSDCLRTQLYLMAMVTAWARPRAAWSSTTIERVNTIGPYFNFVTVVFFT